jgi:hypothetical protein
MVIVCKGIDKMFHDAVSLLNIKTVIHQPDYNKFRAYCKGNKLKSENHL